MPLAFAFDNIVLGTAGFSFPAADFTVSPLGALTTTPTGRGQRRASSGETVQTSASTITNGIGTNIGRVGSLGLGWQGRVQLQAVTNYAFNSDNPDSSPTQFNAETPGAWIVNPSAPIGGLDSTATAYQLTPNGASTNGHGPFLNDPGIGNVPTSYLFWVIGQSTGVGKNAAAFLGPGTNEVDYVPSASWQRVAQKYAASATAKQLSIVDYSFGTFTGQEQGTNFAYRHINAQNSPFPGESVPTTNAARTCAGDEYFYLIGDTACDRGRLSLDIRLIARDTPATLALLGWTLPIWYDAATGNQAYYDPATGKVTVSVGGVSWTTTGSFAWNFGDLVQLYIAVGGGLGAPIDRVWVRVGNGVAVLLGSSNFASAALSIPGNLHLLSRGTTNQWPCWQTFDQPLARSTVPSWVTGSAPMRSVARGAVFRGTGASLVGSAVASQWNDVDGRAQTFAPPDATRYPAIGTGRGGLKNWQFGSQSGTARFMVGTLPSQNLTSYTQFVFAEFGNQGDTTNRVFLDSSSANFRITAFGEGASTYGTGLKFTFNASGLNAAEVQWATGNTEAFSLVYWSGAANEFDALVDANSGLYWSYVQLTAPSATFTRVTLGIDDAHTTDALATAGKVYETLICNVALTRLEILQVLADFYNAAGGYLAVCDGNSQMAGTHNTTHAYGTQGQISVNSAKWVACVGNGTPNEQTPQMTTRFTGGTPPTSQLFDQRFLRRYIVFWEGENDCYTNGANVDPNNTTYAATAWGNMKAYSDTARQNGATRILILTILPTTVGGTPANYENLRNATNALIRANYNTISPTTGQPYFDGIIDVGNTSLTVSPIGNVSTVTGPYYSGDQQHLGDLGQQYVGQQVAPILDGFSLIDV